MKIELTYAGSNYEIIVEPSSYTTYKLGTVAEGKNKGEPTQTNIGYFTNVANAVKRIVQTELSDTDEKVSLLAYTERIETAYKELLKQTDL